jgi:hypothetical protein
MHRINSIQGMRSGSADFSVQKGDPILGLFQTILESGENTNYHGNRQYLHGFLNVAGMLPGIRAAEQQMQPIIGVIGAYLQDALNKQQQANSQAAAEQTFSDLSQPGTGLQEVENLLGRRRFDVLIGEIAQRLGLDSQAILQFLPALIPVVMRLLAQRGKGVM